MSLEVLAYSTCFLREFKESFGISIIFSVNNKINYILLSLGIILGLVNKVFANGTRDRGSTLGWAMPKI